MKIHEYKMIEKYMLSCMQDSAHDKEHIYRVLYTALDIAEYEKSVDYDILIAACLLHDIGRKEQFENSSLDHASVGAEKALIFLLDNGFSKKFAEAVAGCIMVHRYRSDVQPFSIEEKILFDADKVDVTGSIGIARTIFYQGKVGLPLYSVNEAGEVLDGMEDINSSFFKEYKYKLEKLYTRFYTERGKQIALQRQHAAKSFYENMLQEIIPIYKNGKNNLNKKLL